MKKSILILLALIPCFTARAQKSEIVKTGLNFGPLPAIAYDADKGFQYGAILNIYNYGDGTSYPNYDSKVYLEASFFTKGSQLYQLMYDNKSMIPGVRWSSALTAAVDKAMDFYGFNGYESWFNQDRIAIGGANKKGPQDPAQYLYTPFYRMDRVSILAKTDFIGDITSNFKWEAGYHFGWFRQGAINRASINKGKPDYNVFPDSESTLYENYLKWGLISPDEADGGVSSSLRLGLLYDSRDKEGAPTRGIWAEGHLIAAPKWLGTTNPYTRYSLTMRQYFPIIRNDVLTFAYRVNYEGTLGKDAPYYVLPFITVMGENGDKDGMGGYRTVRGMLRNRVVGLDMATWTAEMRWRFVSFSFANQNIALGLSAFSDGSMVTRGRDMSFRGDAADKDSYLSFIGSGKTKDTPHITMGSGFRFIMNENFIVALEYGTPLSHFVSKTNPIYNQDGTGAFYINIGYLF